MPRRAEARHTPYSPSWTCSPGKLRALETSEAWLLYMTAFIYCCVCLPLLSFVRVLGFCFQSGSVALDAKPGYYRDLGWVQ